MTEPVLLAIGVGVPLLFVGLYASWLARRVGRLERDEHKPPEAPGEPGDGPPSPED